MEYSGDCESIYQMVDPLVADTSQTTCNFVANKELQRNVLPKFIYQK